MSTREGPSFCIWFARGWLAHLPVTPLLGIALIYDGK